MCVDQHMDKPGKGVGVLVIRIWTERGSASALRARITWMLDVAASDEVVKTSATVEEIDAHVREWLNAFQARCAR
jgi:hypothetical protein